MSNIFDQITSASDPADSSAEALSQPLLQPLPPAHADAAQAVQYTQRQLKDASQELLKYGLLEMDSKPNLYQTAINHQQQINDILEPLDLALKIDDIRGLAFLVVANINSDAEVDEWSHPLVRRQRLNLEQSLLVAILRQHYVTHELENGIGSAGAVVALDDLIPQLNIYLGKLGSEMAEQNRLRNLLDKLKGHGIVSEIDQHDQVKIRPIITHVANPENLTGLLQILQQQSQSPLPHTPQTHREGDNEH